MFGVGTAVDDGFDESSGVRAGLLCPADKARGAPFRILPMRRRHMFFDRGVLMGYKATGMAGHALAFAKDLHGVVGEPDLESFAFKFIRHAVVVIVDFDVVVDVDGGKLPFGVLVGSLWQRQSVGRAKRAGGGIA